MFTDDELLRITIQGQINAEEAKQFRAVREFIIGDPSAKGRLQAIDSQIAALRAQLT